MSFIKYGIKADSFLRKNVLKLTIIISVLPEPFEFYKSYKGTTGITQDGCKIELIAPENNISKVVQVQELRTTFLTISVFSRTLLGSFTR